MLLNFESVMFRSGGNSMSPQIWSGQRCTYIPITGDLAEGDIVFCEVQHCDQPRTEVKRTRRFFAHKVLEIGEESVFGRVYWIGNKDGHCNGWACIANLSNKFIGVYGRFVAAEW